MILIIVSAFLLSLALVISADVLLGVRKLIRLSSVSANAGPLEAARPMVSVIVAARNEERHIENALTSILALDYRPLEIIVVNDRSDDLTGEILKKVKAKYAQLEIVTISELPHGWLGKNHALHFGAQRAKGELLLFTDADIIFDPTSLSRAVTYYRQAQLDHLTLLPGLRPPKSSHGVRAFNVFFTLSLFLMTQCWRARKPGVRGSIGIGAFNLISQEAYKKIGTHEAIRLRPDDDLKLGLLVKRHGLKQDLVLGDPLVSLEFYTSMREAISGFNKNSFCSLEYNVFKVTGALFALIMMYLWPIEELVFGSGLPAKLCGGIVLITVFTLYDLARKTGQKGIYALGYPFCVIVLMFIILRSTFLTLLEGGVRWRGTFYPLEELRKNRI
jgi:glycosyltransferase involved in cell wall biosynthesis